MAGDGHRGLEGADALALLHACTDLLATVDATGGVRWVNPAGLEMLGRTADEVGTFTVWDVIATEDHQLAAQGMMLATATPELVAPSEYGLRRSDGTQVRVEIFGSMTATEDGPRFFVVGRPVEHRMHREFEQLAQGAPFEDLVRAALARLAIGWPGYDRTFVFNALDGNPVVLGDALSGPIDPTSATPDGTLPWEVARRSGEEQFALADSLCEPHRSVALAAGYDACLVVPLPDPLGEPACLVTWRTKGAPVPLERLWQRGGPLLLLRMALERRAAQATLETLANTDPLTRLANRAAFFQHVESTDRPRDGQAVVFIDLDEFKPINDAHGHRAGDAVLRAFAERLRGLVREHDVVARLGGDEFAVMMSSVTAASDATALAERILAALDEPFSFEGIGTSVKASIGIAVDLSGRDPTSELVDRADTAMYTAKRSDTHRWHLAPGHD